MREVVGEQGPAVLLLPGGAEAVQGFFPVIEQGLVADPGCRIVRIDRPGTEGSDVDGPLADAADALHAALADLGTGPVVVVGQSLGGAVGLLLAAAHPDDVAALVLLDATPVHDAELADRIEQRAASAAKLARNPIGRRVLGALLRGVARRSARKHRMAPAVRDAMFTIAGADLQRLARAASGLGALARAFDPSRLPRIPAVVVTAERGPDDPMRRAHERLATALDAPLVSWPGAEHAVHLTHPDEVLEVVRGVVARV